MASKAILIPRGVSENLRSKLIIMRAFLLFTFLLLFMLPPPSQSQGGTESFAVAIFENNKGVALGPLVRGVSYIATGYIIPWDIYQDSCESFPECGFMFRDSVINDDGTVSYFVTPQDTAVVIGDWDCRGMFLTDFNEVNANGGLADNSTQTFTFYNSGNSLSPCPGGCTIVTEGPVILASKNGPDENVWFDRTIAGATNQFKSIRGEVNQVRYNKVGEQHEGKGRIQEVIFHFSESEEPEQFFEELDVSVNANSITLIGYADSLGNPGFGSNLTMEGVIYSGGTFENDPDSGMDPNGNATLDSIGKWTARGWWISNRVDNNIPLGHRYTLEDGFVMANQQIFEFTHPTLGPLQIMTEGRDFSLLDSNNIVQRAVVGATDALTGHRGECIEDIVGINASGGFNFSYAFETQKVITSAKEPITPRKTLSLFPNPASDHLAVALNQVKEKGDYSIEIFDVTGELVLHRVLNVSTNYFQLHLDVSAIPPGWYGLVLKSGNLVVDSERFIKVR
jgi:hypothetical protein